jgi:hypothetical protein
MLPVGSFIDASTCDSASSRRSRIASVCSTRSQLDAHLALELAQLLRHRRRALVQGSGDGGDGAAHVQLAQQAQPTDVPHISLRTIGSAEGYSS